MQTLTTDILGIPPREQTGNLLKERMTEDDSKPQHQRLAHFELYEELGRGGMGVVYRARDVRLGRQVAIKLLPVAFAGDPDRRSRFLREARAAAQLNHANIATLYEYGEAEWTPPSGEDELAGAEPRKVIYLAMEYVEGQDLAPGAEGGGLSLQQTLDYGIQISEALAAAHAAGVIHRDLKPQNLRVTPDGRIKILDFGLAKMIQAGSVVEEPMLTAHGAIVGTAPYMAPEQLQGASEVDSRCDLFSFGVVLYQMLTGRLPFKAQRLVDYVKALTNQTPAPASDSNPEVSPQLEQVVSRLLAKEPADRYDSALRVGEDLKAIARGQKIEPPPSRTRAGDSIFGEVLQPFRRPWVGWLVGAVFLALLLGVWWSNSRPAGTTVSETPIKMVHMPAFENLSGDSEKDQVCRGMGLALENSFQEVPVIVVREATDAENLGAPMRLEGVCQSMGEKVSILLRLIDRGSGVMVWSRAIEAPPERVVPEMTWAVAQALDVAVLPEVRERLDRTPARSVTALTHYFRGLERQNRFDDEKALEEAVTQFREALQLETDFALAHVGLSEALRRLARLTNDQARKAEAENQARIALDVDPDLVVAQIALSKLLRDEGRYQEAIEHLEALLGLQPKNMELALQLALTQLRSGHVQQATAILEESLGRASVEPASRWRYWNQLGAYLLEIPDYEGAQQAFLKADDLAGDQSFVPKQNLAGLDLARGHYEDAFDWLTSIPFDKRSKGFTINLGNAYFGIGDYEKAVEVYSEAIRIDPEEPMSYANRGDALLRAGHSDSARQDYEQASEKIRYRLNLDPKNDLLRVRQLLYLAKSGQCGEALPQAETLIAEIPETVRNRIYLAKSYALCRDEDRALELVSELIARGVSAPVLCSEMELEALCRSHQVDQFGA